MGDSATVSYSSAAKVYTKENILRFLYGAFRLPKDWILSLGEGSLRILRANSSARPKSGAVPPEKPALLSGEGGMHEGSVHSSFSSADACCVQ